MPEPVVRLLDNAARALGISTGVASAVGGAEPNHLGELSQRQQRIRAGARSRRARRHARLGGRGPLSARKTYAFRRGQYAVDLTLTVVAQPAAAGAARHTRRWCACIGPSSGRTRLVDSYSFKGPVLYDGDQFEWLDFEDLAGSRYTQTVKGGWFAAIQHHFLAAAVPPSDDARYRPPRAARRSC